jgi:hypothetical protein
MENMTPEQYGNLQQNAASASLDLLAVLGAIQADDGPAYRQEVGTCLVRVLIALAAVRRAVEGYEGEMPDLEFLDYIANWVGTGLHVDAKVMTNEILADTRVV